MPTGYLEAMPTAERVLADLSGTDSLDTRARRLAAMEFLGDVVDILASGTRLNAGLTPDELRLRLDYGSAWGRLFKGSADVPGLKDRFRDLCCGKPATVTLRQQILDRYFSRAWQEAFLTFEETVRPDDPRNIAPRPDSTYAKGWVRVWPSAVPRNLNAVAFAAAPARLFARVGRTELLQSFDDGARWTDAARLPDGGTGSYPLAVVGEDVLPMPVSTYITPKPTAGWMSDTNFATSFAVIDTTAFAALFGHGMLASSDHGKTWARVGMPGDPEQGEVIPQITALATFGSFLFIATENLGIFRSADGGSTWTAMSAGPPGFDRAVGTIAANARQVYVSGDSGSFVSTRTGTTWSPFVAARGGLATVTLHRFAFDSAGNVYASSHEGLVYVRSAGSGSWRAVSAGFPPQPPGSFYPVPLMVHGDYLYAGNHKGIWRRRITEILSVAATGSPASRPAP